MISTFFIVGEIKKITVTVPKDPRKPKSAVLLVQYGSEREATNGPVEFLNGVMVRIPNFKYPQIKHQLHIGETIQINGHLQGILRSSLKEGHMQVELVADKVFVNSADENGIKPSKTHRVAGFAE